MRVREILRSKGDTVYQISPSASLADVVDRLVRFNCGSLLVAEGDTIIGIITERDILRASAAHRTHLDQFSVRDHMTRDLVTGHPDDEVSSVMGLMTRHRIRHLPIMDQGRLAGLISIGDVVKSQFDALAIENHYLKTYIQS